MAPVTTLAPADKSATPRSWRRAILKGCLWGLLLALAFEIANVLLGPNFHVVIPGAIYRTAQPSARRLSYLIRHLGIRTVVNLRGTSDPTPWYLDECRTTSALDVSLEDLPFSATRLPSESVVRRLVEVIDRSDYPILFHCNRGIDRTGMAVAMTLLLHSDIALDKARWQLSPRHGHLPLGRTGNIDRFFELYEDWLADKQQDHSRAAFRQWIEHEYCPGECRCQLEVLTPEQLQNIPVGRSVAVKVRAKNTSVMPWVLQPGTNAGVHCLGRILQGDCQVAEERAGLFHATVTPGQSIDLTLALPPLGKPGRYVLSLDMSDPQHAVFHQLGSGPFCFDLEVK